MPDPNRPVSDPRRPERQPNRPDAGQPRLADADGLRRFFADVAARHGGDISRLLFLCIGTDRSTGDSLGPWVGTLLRQIGFPRVIGTLDAPCDADRFADVAASLPAGEPVVAVDACLGRPENVGRFLVAEGPLQPASSVGRGFAPVGSYSVAAIVNANGPKPYWTLQTTSLHRVLLMAQDIADAIAAQRPEAERGDLNSPRAFRYNGSSHHHGNLNEIGGT